MNYETLIVEVKDKVGRIVFNRPKVLNAYSEAMSKEFIRAVDQLSKDPEARVVVITGSGRAFMAGADVSMLKGWVEAPGGGAEVAGILSQFFSGHCSSRLGEKCPQPVIAAVNGLDFGRGCEVILGCDIRIAVESAQFGQPEIKLGIMTGAGGSQRLPRLVGTGKAMEMVLTGDPIDAAEALRWGLVNKVVPDDQLDQAVDELVGKLLKKSATALRLSKEAVIAATNMGLYEGVAHELKLFSGIFETADAKEGVAAFLEKRKPTFNKEDA
jgi:enoyl-CoA hydratase